MATKPSVWKKYEVGISGIPNRREKAHGPENLVRERNMQDIIQNEEVKRVGTQLNPKFSQVEDLRAGGSSVIPLSPGRKIPIRGSHLVSKAEIEPQYVT